MRTRTLAAAALVALAGAAAADPPFVARGVAAPSGATFTSDLGLGDADDYVVAGLRGTPLSVVVRATKGSTLSPEPTLLRPDGTVVAEEDGLVVARAGVAAKARFRLDASGSWTVRVSARAGGPPTGAYAVTIVAPPPRRATAALERPDADGRFRFAAPALGGATLRLAVKAPWPRPTFESFVDPRGARISGAPFDQRGNLKTFKLPEDLPPGDCALTLGAVSDRYQGPVTLTCTLTPPKAPKRRTTALSPNEPLLMEGGVTPTSGGADVVVTVRGLGLLDPAAPDGAVGLRLGDAPLADVRLLDGGLAAAGRIPAGVAPGVHDVVATSTSGQTTWLSGAFEIVPPPSVASVDPPLGPAAGGIVVTMRGRSFRAGRMALEIDGILQPISPTVVDAATMRFSLPPHAEGAVVLRALDLDSRQRSGGVPFEYSSAPLIGRVAPSLVPIFSNESVTLTGINFSPDDRVFVETATAGVFEDVNASGATYVDSTRHRFVAPSRPKGAYQVHVESAIGRPLVKRPKTLSCFSFVDVTAASGLAGGSWDAVSSALADFDGDGDLDLFLASRGAGPVAAASQTRVLRNDGAARFTDVTAATMPAVHGDDWRADAVAAADVDLDGDVDLVLTTNSRDVPAPNASHTRILVNEPRAVGAADRVFRDRTIDLFAPVRMTSPLRGEASYVADEFRGLDLWVGDIDKSRPGRPSIVITHDETRQEFDVSCGGYCPFNGCQAYSYSFYWGGSRAFTWKDWAGGGLGGFRFDAQFFPRAGGLADPIVLPNGAAMPFCNADRGMKCADTFTPFTGKRLAAGDLDGDGKTDFAVVADHEIVVRETVTSSLQVAVQGFDAAHGCLVFDLTPQLAALGLDLSGDAVAVGRTDAPVVAVARRRAVGPSALTLLRFAGAGAATTVADVSAQALPAVDADERLEASRLRFADFDGDDVDDLLLLADATASVPSGLRVLRGADGALRRLAAASVSGDELAVGDVSGDGVTDFLISRTTGTTVVRTDR
jgi:hypothetical protein